MRAFHTLLQHQWEQQHFLCVGLDAEYEKIPASLRTDSIGESILAFNTAIIDATKEYVAAYKPNTAFYEAYGAEGIRALEETTAYIRATVPEVVIIIDAKRADIGNTNIGYARFVFDVLQGDAVTMQPYMGGEALEPFFERTDKGIFILCRTSNSSAAEIQDLSVDGRPLYEHVAHLATEKWNSRNNCGLVVGATFPEEMQHIRAIAPNLPFLIPGVGAQGGDVEKTVHAAMDAQKNGFLISVSRSIMFASSGDDYAEAAHAEAERIHTEIFRIRNG